MSNIVLLFTCLILGVLLRASGKLPDNAPATINGFITNVALPALVLTYIHGADPKLELIGAVVMPWILFLIGAAVFWVAGARITLLTQHNGRADDGRRSR